MEACLSGALEDYLRVLQLWHIYCSPYRSQTDGKLERFHQTLKARLNLLVYASPEALRAAMAEFIEFYNRRRYHEGIGNVTPADVYDGRWEEILKRREDLKQATLESRFRYIGGRRQTKPGANWGVNCSFEYPSQVSRVLKTHNPVSQVGINDLLEGTWLFSRGCF